MAANYHQIEADDDLRHDVQQLTRLAVAEDLRDSLDWTTVCFIRDDTEKSCHLRARSAGIAAGLIAIQWVLDEFDADVRCDPKVGEGQHFDPGDTLAVLRGNARDLLTSERTVLNLVSRMCGIATMTARYVDQIGNQNARLYDTRKTTPGMRLIEKYAVRCGGGTNHRSGLHDGILIKDNHIAMSDTFESETDALGDAANVDDATARLIGGVRRAVAWRGQTFGHQVAPEIVEVEVDTLEQFDAVLPLGVDIILLDNFTLDELAIAVQRRNQRSVDVQLEASGNVRIDTIGSIATTGVDRISSGALTHQAVSLDLGLDWVGKD